MAAWDVVVVGGGVAGAAVAYHLTKQGARTALVDRRDPGRATDAGAGILSPETSGNPLDAWFDLVLACGRHYRELIPELDDTSYERCGLLAVALADWDIETYQAVVDLARARAKRSGAALEEIDAQQTAARHPGAAPVTRALWHPEAARVDGKKLAAALTADANLIEGEATLTVRNGRVVSVDVDGEHHSCGSVVIAGGAWSPQLGNQLGVRIPVRPERGQILHLQIDDTETGAWPILQPAFGFYVVAWPGGRVAVGATREPRSGFDARPTVAGVRQLLDEVVRVVPGLQGAAIAEVRVGLRPISVDDLPILGPLPTVPNVYLATGYGANGLLLAPWCGRLIADAIGGQELSDAFAPARFT